LFVLLGYLTVPKHMIPSITLLSQWRGVGRALSLAMLEQQAKCHIALDENYPTIITLNMRKLIDYPKHLKIDVHAALNMSERSVNLGITTTLRNDDIG
jgi:hypothetical protein